MVVSNSNSAQSVLATTTGISLLTLPQVAHSSTLCYSLSMRPCAHLHEICLSCSLRTWHGFEHILLIIACRSYESQNIPNPSYSLCFLQIVDDCIKRLQIQTHLAITITLLHCIHILHLPLSPSLYTRSMYSS